MYPRKDWSACFSFYFHKRAHTNALIIFLHKCRGTGELYEDDGKTTQYMSGKYANTTFSFTNMWVCNSVILWTVKLHNYVCLMVNLTGMVFSKWRCSQCRLVSMTASQHQDATRFVSLISDLVCWWCRLYTGTCTLFILKKSKPIIYVAIW